MTRKNHSLLGMFIFSLLEMACIFTTHARPSIAGWMVIVGSISGYMFRGESDKWNKYRIAEPPLNQEKK